MQECQGGVGATGAAKKGTSRGEQEGPGDTRLGPLYQCPNMLRDRQNCCCESGTKRERRVGVTRSRVEEVSLVERDLSCRGSDLPNQVGQVIELEEKGEVDDEEMWHGNKGGETCGKSGNRVGQLVRLKAGKQSKRGCGMRTRDAG